MVQHQQVRNPIGAIRERIAILPEADRGAWSAVIDLVANLPTDLSVGILTQMSSILELHLSRVAAVVDMSRQLGTLAEQNEQQLGLITSLREEVKTLELRVAGLVDQLAASRQRP